MQRQWLPVTSIHENADRPSSVSNTSKSIQYHNISQQTDAGLPPLVTARSDYEHLLGKRPRTQRPDLSTTMHTSIEPPSGGMTVHFTRRLSSGAASSGKDMAGTGARRDTQQDPPRECYSSNHRLTPTHAADAGALNYDQPFFDDLNASAPSQTCLQPSPYPQNYRMSHLPHANLPRLHQYDLQHDNHQLGLTNSMPEITIRTPLDGHNISASYPFTSPYLPNSDLSSPLYYRRNNTIKEACCEDTFDYDVLSSNVQNLDQFTPPTIHDPNNSICPRSDAFFPQYTALYTSHSNNTVNYFSDNDEMDDNLLCRSSRLLSHTNAEFTPGSYNYEYTYSIPSSHTLQHGSAHAQTLHQTSQVLPAGYADSEQPSSHGSNVGRQRPRSTKRRSLDRPGEREEVAEKRRNRTVCWYHHKKKRKCPRQSQAEPYQPSCQPWPNSADTEVSSATNGGRRQKSRSGSSVTTRLRELRPGPIDPHQEISSTMLATPYTPSLSDIGSMGIEGTGNQFDKAPLSYDDYLNDMEMNIIEEE